MRSLAAELARELAIHSEALVHELLPHGKRKANQWRVGSITDEPGGSLAVHLSGPKRGRWFDYAAGLRGDALDLVAEVVCWGDKKKAMEWARDWLHLPSRDEERQPRPPRREQPLPPANDNPYRAAALKIWKFGARAVVPGDPVWRYLEGRGIALGRLPRIPSALRYHPGLWNVESQRAWPAMVAMIADAEGHNCAVHRTWLEERNLACEDRPMVGKARLDNPKLTLGQFRGGYIRAWRGAEGRPWTALVPGETLLVSEGIEDLLSYLQFQPQWRAACAVSLSFMLAMELPAEFTEIRILAQRDRRMTADGQCVQPAPARKLLAKVIDRFESEGRKVYLWTPPAFVKDINEYIQRRATSGGRTTDGS